jgi:hypothetical protein
MENSKLNLVHTNRVEKHNGKWYGVWVGTIVTLSRNEKVKVYIMQGMIQNIGDIPIKYNT